MEMSGALVQTSLMGIYTRVTGFKGLITRFGRPVYQHANKQYLFYWEASKYWLIGFDYTKNSGGVTIASDALDAHLVRGGGWREWYYSAGRGTWQTNSAIKARCTEPGMHFAAAQHSLCFPDLVETHAQSSSWGGPRAGALPAGAAALTAVFEPCKLPSGPDGVQQHFLGPSVRLLLEEEYKDAVLESCWGQEG